MCLITKFKEAVAFLQSLKIWITKVFSFKLEALFYSEPAPMNKSPQPLDLALACYFLPKIFLPTVNLQLLIINFQASSPPR